MTRMSIAFLVLGLSFVLAAQAQDKTDDVTLRVVKYDTFKDEIVKNKGKVVLVDVWGDFCVPCKKAFPHTVELHKKFESKGLVVISVSVDPIEDKAKALKFLKKVDAKFTNFLLDEPEELWQKKFRTDGVPCMYVFSRQGKWTQLKDDELENTKALDRIVEELIAEK